MLESQDTTDKSDFNATVLSTEISSKNILIQYQALYVVSSAEII